MNSVKKLIKLNSAEIDYKPLVFFKNFVFDRNNEKVKRFFGIIKNIGSRCRDYVRVLLSISIYPLLWIGSPALQQS